MPELPEVETIKRSVSNVLCGAKIIHTDIFQPKLRLPIPQDFAASVQNSHIMDFSRIAKYMLMHLDNGKTIIWHFGMSGHIKIESEPPAVPEKHDHLVMQTSKGTLVYNDPRRFGIVIVCESDNLKSHKLFCRLGLDPWDKNLTADYLLNEFRNKKTPVKISLLNQEIICGIGNIYASEILYGARIHPERPSESITRPEANLLIKHTRAVLEKAIDAGGSTIHDYKKPDGDIGYFQQKHCVYNKTGQKCPQCRCRIAQTGGIQKIVLGGRSTFYCATLQK